LLRNRAMDNPSQHVLLLAAAKPLISETHPLLLAD